MDEDFSLKLIDDEDYLYYKIDNLESKKCIHGSKSSYHCKECKGNAFCEHNLKKQYCFECRKPRQCWCKINKYKCGFCRANEICKHGIKSARCVECKKVRTTLCLLTDYQEGLNLYEKCDCKKCCKNIKKSNYNEKIIKEDFLNEDDEKISSEDIILEKHKFIIEKGNKLLNKLFEIVTYEGTQGNIENNLHICLSYLSGISIKSIYTIQLYICKNYMKEIKLLINYCKSQLSINYMLRFIWLLINKNIVSLGILEKYISLKKLLKKVLSDNNLDEQNKINIDYILRLV